MFQEYKEVVLTGKPLVREVSIGDDDRGPWMRIQAVKCRDGIAVTATDITEWKRDTKRLLYLAQHDALTGLPNRSCLREHITDGMRRADQSSSRLAVLMIDLDSFKQINDTLGHASGDIVLKTIAERLTAAVRASDCVIRLGGDEFVVVMPDITYLSNVEICTERILSSLRAPIAIDGRSMRISGSIGVAIYPDDATSVEALLTHADAGMYAVKEAGRDDLFSRSAPAPLVHAGDSGWAAKPAVLQLRRKSCKTARRAPVL
jgi:diguanylate cyclase (GGDEF)-like protein